MWIASLIRLSSHCFTFVDYETCCSWFALTCVKKVSREAYVDKKDEICVEPQKVRVTFTSGKAQLEISQGEYDEKWKKLSRKKFSASFFGNFRRYIATIKSDEWCDSFKRTEISHEKNHESFIYTFWAAKLPSGVCCLRQRQIKRHRVSQKLRDENWCFVFFLSTLADVYTRTRKIANFSLRFSFLDILIPCDDDDDSPRQQTPVYGLLRRLIFTLLSVREKFVSLEVWNCEMWDTFTVINWRKNIIIEMMRFCRAMIGKIRSIAEILICSASEN